ncbi:PmoA family protein [Verrucomicrobiales bacterium]|nr:PmoA family protein [Verrucomicrobiales bacterium]
MNAPKNKVTITFFIALCLMINGSIQAKEILKAIHDKEAGTIRIYRDGITDPIITQNAKANFRPYIHPIKSPNGNGELTQYSPGHHKHQTGLYWGFTRVNGRDYFHNPRGDYWRRKSVQILQNDKGGIRWQTEYLMLNKDAQPLITETQTWEIAIREDGKMVLDLKWQGLAHENITIAKYNYGGLFLRMPWKKGIKAEVINSKGDTNQRGEGKRAKWIDLGMEIQNLKNEGHIAIFDHPKNDGFPNMWRIDGQFGVGPARSRLGSWKIEKGQIKSFLHRFIIYEGEHSNKEIIKEWNAWSK